MIIDPSIIRDEIKPTLRQLEVATLPLVILTICIIFLLAVSVLGFRR
jgi:hypothetical protein